MYITQMLQDYYDVPCKYNQLYMFTMLPKES